MVNLFSLSSLPRGCIAPAMLVYAICPSGLSTELGSFLPRLAPACRLPSKTQSDDAPRPRLGVLIHLHAWIKSSFELMELQTSHSSPPSISLLPM